MRGENCILKEKIESKQGEGEKIKEKKHKLETGLAPNQVVLSIKTSKKSI